ncbi:MAG TPA: anthranilate synthase component I, partial [Ktedonobacteraceae bacterium]|nr:anthranilate synthase component I [Ktedonobacteraceae bacterium]
MDFPMLDEIRQAREVECANHQDDARKPLLPICVDVLADMETPVSAYCKTALGPYSFLLESVAGGERIARYSFIGIDPYLVMTQRGETAILRRARETGIEKDSINRSFSLEQIDCHDPLNFIQAELGQYRLVTPAEAVYDELPIFHGGAVGYLAYEVAARFERLPVPEHDELGLPQAIF